MKVIIAWDGDHIGREVGRASLADDVDGLRRISQAIDRGNKIWESWVVMNGGSMISFGGDEGRAEILAEKLTELPKIRDQYAQAVQSTVSVGVGTKLSEADRAMMVAKIRGGDKIVLYTPDLEEEIKAATEAQGKRSEADKLAEEYLTKADGPPQPPAMVQGAAAGFTGASQPAAPSVDTPQVEASEHSQGEAAQAMMENDNPPPPEATAAPDFEGAFHGLAQKQGQQDQGLAPGGDPQEQIKAQVVQVLQALKAQAPILEQIKASAPDTYKAIMDMTMAVIAMAKQLNQESPGQTVKEIDDRARSQAQIEVPLPPEEGEGEKKDGTKKSETFRKAEQIRVPLKHIRPDPQNLKEAEENIRRGQSSVVTGPVKLYRRQGQDGYELGDGHHRFVEARDRGETHIDAVVAPETLGKAERSGKDADAETAVIKERRKTPEARASHDFEAATWTHPNGHPRCRLCGDEERTGSRCPGADHDGLTKADKKTEPEWHDCDDFGHCWGTDVAGDYCLMCGGHREILEADLDKASLSPGGKPPATRHHLNLPVGSKVDPGPDATREVGKIKVQHPESGKQSWIQARAGQVLSQDGHAISSRNPGGK